MILSGSVVVAANAVTAVVTGAFGSSYQVADPSTTWLTGFSITGKSATQFTVTFDAPAPAGGGTLDWLVNTVPERPGAGSAISGTVAVEPNAVQVVVRGTFGPVYQVADPSASWGPTSFQITERTSSQFTVVFDTPAPSAGGTLDWLVIAPVSGGANCVLAGTLVTRLRSKIPDNVWVNGAPQPEMDGKFRAVEMYAWLDEASKTLTQLTGWTIDDWYAMPVTALQPWYDVDPKWVSMREAFSQQWPLSIQVTEGQTIWPNTLGQYNTNRQLIAFWRRLAAQLQVGLWPSPSAVDPSTTLTAGINAAGDDPILVTSTTGFLTYGYVRIEDEILQYQQRNTTPASIAVISRGVCGTTAMPHPAGATVQHLSFWIKGKRLPTDIVNSQSCIEIPRGWMSHLETYVLAQCRFARERHAEGMQLMALWDKACRDINADPNWKPNRVGYIRAWGEPAIGPLRGRSGWGIVVP